jgi:ribosome-binding factor A
MPREFKRSERVSDAIQQEVSVLICDSIRDPRVGMVSVTDVEVSRDLAYAKVHVTFVGEKSEAEIEEAIRALNGAAGYLRKLLASSIKMRKTPQLTFLFDESGRRGQQLSALIDYAVSSEKNRGNTANDDSVDF